MGQHTEQGIGPARGWLSRMGNHAYGVGFLVVVALLVGLSVAAFQKRFTEVVLVTLLTDRAGSQLQTSSDVKLRGLIVGEVREVESTGGGARLELALQPDKVRLIPADVSARLLPKTLFGERYVDLVAPASGRSGRAIREGDTIGQDRSSVAIELERVFDDLLPVLRAVRPEQLATTLNAVADALEGRGARLGDNLVLVDDYLKALNPKMPVIEQDIRGLADLADTYAQAGPEVVSALRNLVTTSATVVAKRQALAGFLAGTAGFARTTTGVLDRQGERLVRVGRVNRPTVELLARYSPQYPCFTEALVAWAPRMDEAFRDGKFHLTIELSTAFRPGYQPGEEPRWGENRAPSCQGLPNPGGSQQNPRHGTHFDDGTKATGGTARSALPALFAGDSGAGIPDPDAGLAGTTAEQQLVTALLHPDATAPSAITTLLAGPMLRGSVVDQR